MSDLDREYFIGVAVGIFAGFMLGWTLRRALAEPLEAEPVRVVRIVHTIDPDAPVNMETH